VRTTSFEYPTFADLQDELRANGDEHDLALADCPGVRDGEWLLATFAVGEETTSLAGCVVDLNGELRLSFEERDWYTLLRFARGDGLPSVAPVASVSKLATVTPPPNCPVLVVDANPDVQAVVRAVLEAKGFDAKSATSAEEAFERLRGACVKLIIVDWDLPGMSGIEFCRRLRREPAFREMPVLVLTAHASQSAILEAFEAGADDFVSKPFRAHELGIRILGLLGRGHSEELRHATG